MKKILIALLLIGLLSACGGQPTEVPASSTGEPAAPLDAPTTADTAVPPIEAPSPTVVIPTTPPTEPPAQITTISFVSDVFPILQSRCINCHGGDRTEEGLIMTSYAGIMAGSENGAIVIPGDAVNSPMAELILSQKMPKRGPKLTPPQVQIIVDWINQGALEN